MPKICYVPKKFSPYRVGIIAKANEIIANYASQGYSLTLRQLYYQFVSKDLIANKQSEYNRLGCIVSDARKAGLIDWDSIEDRTRALRSEPAWASPASIISSAAAGYQVDLWKDQDVYVEVWFEKDALMGVFERASERYRTPYFSCRGYTSDSEVWGAARRLARRSHAGQTPVVLHFGDHDPSGIDMTRDIQNRLELYAQVPIEVRRLALNMDQVEEYDPPPNPAKVTDSRYEKYQEEYGDESWELDALEPTVLVDLVENEVRTLIDLDIFDEAMGDEDGGKEELQLLSTNYEKAIRAVK